MNRLNLFLYLVLSLQFSITSLLFSQKFGYFNVDPSEIPCCDHRKVQAIIWSGSDPYMTMEKLASYCGPVLWFSPDEPLLGDSSGKSIMIPQAFPFESGADRPVVYYRLREILVREDANNTAFHPDSNLRGHSVIDLKQVAALQLDYFFYYPSEEGLGGHKHDVESAEFKLIVWRRPDCADCLYNLVVTRVTGKAHGVLWYDNTLEIDEYCRFPMHILVEEGKHASCTDKNGDGYYTPGYDVNKRVNDAWGVRDVLRSGTLFTGGFQAWMAKVRQPEDQILPPLPVDSPFRNKYTQKGIYAPENAVYELRPFPSAEKAQPDLVHFIADKGDPNWPEETPNTDLNKFKKWVGVEPFVKSLSISFRADGDIGFSFVFPLFIVKNFEDPLAGGFVLNRIYLKDKHLRDFAWTILYTTSASRWIDGYFSAGYEWDKIDLPTGSSSNTKKEGDVVLETGLKFRALVTHTPLKFMSKLTDFWGIRIGIKNRGFWDINRMGYVIEVGAGTW
jgi:hypothetical protein